MQLRKIRIRYARKIEEINNYSESFSEQERLVTVTQVLTRIDPDWNLEKTYKISMPLLNAIWEFANNEIKGLEISADTSVLTKEDIKKPSSANLNLSTGEISSGDSNPVGEEMRDLAQPILQDSLVG